LRDLDAATRALYEQIVATPENHRLKEAIEGTVTVSENAGNLRPMVVLVPGIFYQDYPHTGADGAMLRQVADSLNLTFTVIPVNGTAGLDAAAKQINEWLEAADHLQPILLFSLSKGSAEVRHALTQSDAARAFANVIAWVSVSGLPFGTPSFETYLSSSLRSAFIAIWFRFKRWRLDLIRDLLRHRPEAPCQVPVTLPLVQIVAFPEQQDLRDRRSRWLRRELAPLGPNDGFAVITDLEQLPGRIYPIRETDHYLNRIDDLPARISRLISVLIAEASAD